MSKGNEYRQAWFMVAGAGIGAFLGGGVGALLFALGMTDPGLIGVSACVGVAVCIGIGVAIDLWLRDRR